MKIGDIIMWRHNLSRDVMDRCYICKRHSLLAQHNVDIEYLEYILLMSDMRFYDLVQVANLSPYLTTQPLIFFPILGDKVIDMAQSKFAFVILMRKQSKLCQTISFSILNVFTWANLYDYMLRCFLITRVGKSQCVIGCLDYLGPGKNTIIYIITTVFIPLWSKDTVYALTFSPVSAPM